HKVKGFILCGPLLLSIVRFDLGQRLHFYRWNSLKSLFARFKNQIWRPEIRYSRCSAITGVFPSDFLFRIGVYKAEFRISYHCMSWMDVQNIVLT
uniref:Uncharacterized protein n=1 Tax=Ciona savignyi TaxID=51511 RepID=H2Z1R3_CIOSA